MLLTEDESGSESDSGVSASTNMKPLLKSDLKEFVTNLGVAGVEGSQSTHASDVEDLVGIIGLETSQSLSKFLSDFFGFLDESVSLDDLDGFLEKDQLGRFSHPGIVDTVGLKTSLKSRSNNYSYLLDDEFRGVVISTSKSFLGESNNVWWAWEIPLFVSPEGATGSTSSLDFIDDESDSGFLCNLLKLNEEMW